MSKTGDSNEMKMNMRTKVSLQKAISTIDKLINSGIALHEFYLSGRISYDERKIWDQTASPEDLTYRGENSTEFIFFTKSWREISIKKFREMFEDTYILVDFQKKEKDSSRQIDPAVYDKLLLENLKVLGNISKELKDEIKTPLSFLPAKSLLKHNDTVSPLEPDSNMNAVCKYMFSNHDFGEFVDMEKVAAYMTGVDESEIEDTRFVKTAALEVNKKTNEDFGFPIFLVHHGRIALKPHPNPQG
jgi:hypothetical protein